MMPDERARESQDAVDHAGGGHQFAGEKEQGNGEQGEIVHAADEELGNDGQRQLGADDDLLRELIRAHMMAGWLAVRRNLIEAGYSVGAADAPEAPLPAHKRRPQSVKAASPTAQS